VSLDSSRVLLYDFYAYASTGRRPLIHESFLHLLVHILHGDGMYQSMLSLVSGPGAVSRDQGLLLGVPLARMLRVAHGSEPTALR